MFFQETHVTTVDDCTCGIGSLVSKNFGAWKQNINHCLRPHDFRSVVFVIIRIITLVQEFGNSILHCLITSQFEIRGALFLVQLQIKVI